MHGEACERELRWKGLKCGVKQYRPTSPGRRFQTVSDKPKSPATSRKSPFAPLNKKAGRNNHTVTSPSVIRRRRKRRYRIIDFKRNKDGVPAKVATVEYDLNCSARIALLHYADGEKRYILHPEGPEGRRHGRHVPRTSSPATPCRWQASPSVRSSMLLSCSLTRAAWARSAGTSIRLMGKEGSTQPAYAVLRNASRAAHLPCNHRRGW